MQWEVTLLNEKETDALFLNCRYIIYLIRVHHFQTTVHHYSKAFIISNLAHIHVKSEVHDSITKKFKKNLYLQFKKVVPTDKILSMNLQFKKGTPQKNPKQSKEWHKMIEVFSHFKLSYVCKCVFVYAYTCNITAIQKVCEFSTIPQQIFRATFWIKRSLMMNEEETW